MSEGATFFNLEVADTPWQRMRGLLGRPPLQERQGLLIRPCNMIHTLGMRYSIDVVFIDAHGNVLKIAARIPSRKISFCFRARATLELLAGQAEALGLQSGQPLPRFLLDRLPEGFRVKTPVCFTTDEGTPS